LKKLAHQSTTTTTKPYPLSGISLNQNKQNQMESIINYSYLL